MSLTVSQKRFGECSPQWASRPILSGQRNDRVFYGATLLRVLGMPVFICVALVTSLACTGSTRIELPENLSEDLVDLDDRCARFQWLETTEPQQYCEVRAARVRCSDRDVCWLECLERGGADNIGGGCAHVCFAYHYEVGTPGWNEGCREYRSQLKGNE